MSGGSSWNPLQDIKKMTESPEAIFNSVLNGVVNLATGGFVGYEDGKIGDGASTHMAKQTIGAFGGNAGINAEREKTDQLDKAVAANDLERKDQLRRREAGERQASDMGKILRSGKGGAGGNTGTGGNVTDALSSEALGL